MITDRGPGSSDGSDHRGHGQHAPAWKRKQNDPNQRQRMNRHKAEAHSKGDKPLARAFEHSYHFCSADASPADYRRGMSAGAQAYLAKPCELQELRQTIRCLIAGARGVGAGAD